MAQLAAERIRLRRIRHLPADRKREIQEAFTAFDTTKCGSLDCYELKAAMRALGYQVTEWAVAKIIKEHCKDSSNRINMDDYIDAMMDFELIKDPLQNIRYAFKMFLYEDQEKITLENLRDVAEELEEDVSEFELQSMIDEFDADGDGAINEEEFISIMLSEA